MAYVPLSRFVLRAPLLPMSALKDPGRALLEHPLGQGAVALASPSLGATKTADTKTADTKARRAIARYGRRAAFRATPHGLLAGVATGTLAAATRIATGNPRAALDVAWGRAAALGRALLDRPEVRRDVRVRVTPSLLRSRRSICWLAQPNPFAEVREAELREAELREADLDDRLARILDAAVAWTPWKALRRLAGDDANDAMPASTDAASDEDDDADELLLLLIDDGLLVHDLTPPLIGLPPLRWMSARLQTVAAAELQAKSLAAIATALGAGDLARASDGLHRLPGDHPEQAGVHAVLVFDLPRPATLAREAVERAATLVPLLFRLQEALAPPAAERLLQPAIGETLSAVTELFGAGALDLAGLALGDYGVGVDDRDGAGTDAGQQPPRDGPPTALLTLLIDRITATLVAGADQASFTTAELAAALDDVAPSPPPTAELFLTPCGGPRGAPPGTDWLLGLHAPAGASWGRFAAALGPALTDALDELARAESANLPATERLDVAFAPSAALADLGLHPPVRRRALALTGWPDGAAPPVTMGDLELCADAGASAPLALRTRDSQRAVVPSPLSRVRSTTAPGWYQLLAGWSLYRQHAPWALALGPLANAARLPRVAIDGFVVAPGSWRLPDVDVADDVAGADVRRATTLDRKTLAHWRRGSRVPRVVQVGHEDQLLPVDLDDADACADLAGNRRVWELWPPPERGIDQDGRRLEAVIALVDHPDRTERARQSTDESAAAQVGAVPPPDAATAADGWKTFKLFGVEARQDAVLVNVIAPLVRDALLAAEIDAWFFIRYVDGPGRRPHLRLRTRATSEAGETAFARRLQLALQPARRDGAVVTVEIAEYHPEYARFGGEASFGAALRIFESDSTLVTALLDLDEPDLFDPVEELVRSLDALATGLGLTLAQRHQLAGARRAASAGGASDERRRRSDDAEFRTRSRRLRHKLGVPDGDAAGTLLAAHRDRVAVAVAASALSAETRAAILPPLLHLAAVRLGGLDRDLERRAYLLWERTLEGLVRGSTKAGRPTR